MSDLNMKVVGPYDKALSALEQFRHDGTLPPKDEREEVRVQLDKYSEELHDEINTLNDAANEVTDFEIAMIKDDKKCPVT